ncbi:alpha/beta hydrolase family protein [Hymenobacter properus]|uniref:Alpha/beta fold hydrolase n=1 Tax=Hymenobacter properus TaxID=2791026 RepID=A0A931BJ34_9BACT|nr:alpha/beta fold hydrolase [Hymenobacter properus]MBF9142436.1 alpha/beta fold hydrolase [Hymenobacter properus]MBR7721243.1 alpha/beta fold hydrolase [Microvirga sp. SRT04]
MPTPTRLALAAFAAALLSLPSACAQPGRPNLTGDWVGTLGPLELTAHLTDPATGPRTATLDIPAQHAQGLTLQFTAPNDSVYLRLTNPVVAQFAGRRSADGQQLVGQWQQGPRTFPLTLSRGKDAATKAPPKRPQTPKAPFPYQSTDITFKNEKAGITLAGTYTVPAGKGPFPAVALLTGSGPEDRNETILGHQPFAVLADYLTRHGVAVLRFDDRGVGQSGGTLQGTTSADYTTDAQAALAWLRAQPGVKKNHTGLLGHSQGGTAAIGAAGQQGGPDFLVLLAAPALPGDELIVQQVLSLAKVSGVDAVQLLYVERAQRQVIEVIEQNPNDEQARAKLRPLLNYGQSTDPSFLAQVESQIDVATSPDYRHLLADRPAQTLAKVHCPVLALGGSKDRQVPAPQNLAATAAALKTAGNRDVTVKELPDLNHLFQTAGTGGPEEYGTIEETFSPSALQLIGDWIAQHTRK